MRVKETLAWLRARGDYAALPRLFLALGGILGLLYAFLMPPLQVPDERAHFDRIFAISTGACMTPAAQPIPFSVDRLAVIFPSRLESYHPVRLADYRRLMRTPWTSGGEVPFVNANAAIYSCAPYLASALGVELAKLLSQPALVLFYCGRLANLAFYLAAVYWALLIVPFGRPVLFCLALMPMTLHQAASVSADSSTIASAFLLFAYILYLAFDERISSVSNRQLIVLGVLLLFSTLCKFNPWFVLLVLLIPASRFGGSKRKLISAGILLALVLAVSAGWQALDRANALIFQAGRVGSDIYVAENARFILHHPFGFLATMVASIRQGAVSYATEFVGYLGWISIPLPHRLVNGYIVFLLAAALFDGPRFQITPANRLIGAVVIAGSVVSIFALLWTFELPRSCLATELTSLHPCPAPGVQGRYFIPLAPLIVLLLSNHRLRLRPVIVTLACAGMVLLSSGVAMAGIHRTYYGGEKPLVIQAGAYRNGLWVLDIDGNDQFDGSVTPPSGTAYYGGLPGDIPVLGDWTGDGHRKLGIYRHGLWLLDWDGDGKFTAADRTCNFGGLDGDIPVAGDWTGDGVTKIGVYRKGLWLLDINGDGKFESGPDKLLAFGGLPQDIPVVGDWTGKRRSQIGIYRNGVWLLDANGDGRFDNTSANPDLAIPFGGLPTDVPVAGDWNGYGKAKPGIVRDGSQWFLDRDGSHAFPGSASLRFGSKDFVPLVGPWAPFD